MNRQPTESIIAVAMSGGVDSSVAAALLVEQGHSVIGVTMRLPQPDELRKKGTVEHAEPSYITDAKKTANILGIRHVVVDLRDEFQERIINDFCEEYNAGRTPNPCVFCNPQIKFGRLFESASTLGATELATGHYVKREHNQRTGRYLLKTAANTAKDQSYFLYRLTQEQLARSRFPLASFTKDLIRQKARSIGLNYVAEKAESQEICFIKDQKYQQFLQEYLPATSNKPGAIVDTSGNVLGQHQGIHHYTIGQRRGLGIALGSPRYVVAIHPDTNTVVIGENHELFTQKFCVHNLNFVAIEKLTVQTECLVKIRYRNTAKPATIKPGNHTDKVIVNFQTAQRAVTPGQSAVFYDEDIVLGGGIIARSPSDEEHQS